MNYQPTKLSNGIIVQVDLDNKRTKCVKCGEMIRFGIKENGKYIPIRQEGNKFVSHFFECQADNFNKKLKEDEIKKEETNQNFLNSI